MTPAQTAGIVVIGAAVWVGGSWLRAQWYRRFPASCDE